MNVKEEKKLYSQREKYRQKAFLMMLEIAAIIALPAFVAFFLGNYLDSHGYTNKAYKALLLVGSFVVSWAIIIYKYIAFNKKVKDIDRKIKDLKERENVDIANRRR